MIQLLGDCPPDPYKGSALGRHWILPSPDPYFFTHPKKIKKIQNPVGWHGDGVEDEQLLRQSSFDIVAVFGDNVAGFGDNVADFGDIVAGVDGA